MEPTRDYTVGDDANKRELKAIISKNFLTIEAKIVAGADANLREKLEESERKMKWMQSKYNTSVLREKKRAARAVEKMKAKCEIGVRTAELVGLSDWNYWRKRALAAEGRAEQADWKVKRMK